MRVDGECWWPECVFGWNFTHAFFRQQRTQNLRYYWSRYREGQVGQLEVSNEIDERREAVSEVSPKWFSGRWDCYTLYTTFFRFSETLRVLLQISERWVLLTWIWPGWDFIQVSQWWKTSLHFHGTVFDLRKRRKGVDRSMRGCMWRMLSKTGAKPFPRHILAAHIHLPLLSFRKGTQRGSERHNEDLAIRMRMRVYFIQTTRLVVADFYCRYRH